MKEPMNKDEDRMVLCMNIFDQITYEKQFAEAIKKNEAYKPDQGNRHLTRRLSRESKTP